MSDVAIRKGSNKGLSIHIQASEGYLITCVQMACDYDTLSLQVIKQHSVRDSWRGLSERDIRFSVGVHRQSNVVLYTCLKFHIQCILFAYNYLVSS